MFQAIFWVLGIHQWMQQSPVIIEPTSQQEEMKGNRERTAGITKKWTLWSVRSSLHYEKKKKGNRAKWGAQKWENVKEEAHLRKTGRKWRRNHVGIWGKSIPAEGTALRWEKASSVWGRARRSVWQEQNKRDEEDKKRSQEGSGRSNAAGSWQPL